VAVVLDPGRRRHAGGGRIVLWRRDLGCASRHRGAPALAPEAVAAALLRALGLPQSEQLPAPPASCGWPEPPLTVSGYGERGGGPGRPATGPEGREYLESLRSLGYL
jgi:hypothetical protein